MRGRACLLSLALLAFACGTLAASDLSSPLADAAAGDSLTAPRGADPIPCQWTSPDGYKFDFSGLASATGTQVNGKNDDVFSINMCGVSQADGPTGTCASGKALVCMQYNWATAWWVIAINQNTGATYDLTDSSKGAAGGVTLTVKNGAYGPNPSTVQIGLVCQTAGPDNYAAQQDQNNKNLWYVTVTSTKACGSKGGGGGGKKHGLSGGWAFIIFILCATTVYVVGGCLFKRHRQGTQGIESCPNIDFWREFPSLVKDGCKFSWGKVKQWTGRAQGNETYQEFK